MATIDAQVIQQVLQGSGLNVLCQDDVAWVSVPTEVYLDENGQHEARIAVMPRDGGPLVSLWLLPDLAPPEFSLGNPPSPDTQALVLRCQWKNHLTRFQITDDGRLQANVDLLAGEGGLDPSALVDSLVVMAVCIDRLIVELRQFGSAGSSTSAATGFLSPSLPTTGQPVSGTAPPTQPHPPSSQPTAAGTSLDTIRGVGRSVVSNPAQPPQGCTDIGLVREEVIEPGKGIFGRSKKVEKFVSQPTKTHFHGWLLWRQPMTFRQYVSPPMQEIGVHELWLVVDGARAGEFAYLEITESNGGLPGVNDGRTVDEIRVATDHDLLGAVAGWTPRELGATPYILEDTAWQREQNPDESELGRLMGVVQAIGQG